MNEGCSEAIILLRIVDACLGTDIFKVPIRFLVIERVAFAGQSARTTHHCHSAKLTKVLPYTGRLADFAGIGRQIIEVNVCVTGHEQVEPTVAIVITPGGPSAPALPGDTELLSYIGESAVTVVVIQPRHAEISHVQIG